MYNASMLNAQSLACIQKIRSEFAAKPEILIMGMARAISSKLDLPASQVASSTEFYSLQAVSKAKSLVSCMSDIMAFDTQAAMDMVKTMWMVRYKAAYPSDMVYDVPGACSEASFFGYGAAISSSDIKFIQENSTSLILAQNNFSRIICDFLCCTEKEISQESRTTGKK